MDLKIVDDARAVALAGADVFARALADTPGLTAVVATGNSPLGLYAELASRRARAEVDASRMTAFQLDDYLGLDAGDPRSLWAWMDRVFVQPMGLLPQQAQRLVSDAPDPHAECAHYDAAIARAGGLDLAVLGVGPNGHLGFNEPPSQATDPTRVVSLTASSVAGSATYWGSEDVVPRQALTVGMAQLLAARHLLVVVSGAAKRDILRRALTGPVTPDLPASYLQTAARVTVIADSAAWEPAAS